VTGGKRSAVGQALRAYVLLETVIATGLLVVGLAVIGGQFQDSETSVRKMQRRIRAVELAEQQLAQLDLGLVELDSVDEMQEGDFGPRHPDFGWRMTTEPTALEGIYRLSLEIMFLRRAEAYREDDFDHDAAETLFTAYALRPTAQKIDLGVDYGLNDEELDKVSQTLSDTGIPGLDAASFDPTILAKLDFEQMVEVLPVVLDAMGMELGDLEALIPPEILEQLKESGALGEEESEQPEGPGGDSGNPAGGQGGQTGGQGGQSGGQGGPSGGQGKKGGGKP
jgi:uncharacterized membrane protein YgcG